MTQPTPPPPEQQPAHQPIPTASTDAGPPDDRRDSPPEPASAWVQEHEPPATEAERQAQETIRSVSRLEESN